MTAAPTTVLFDADGVIQRVGEGWLARLTALLGLPADDGGAAARREIFAAEETTMTGHLDWPTVLTATLQRLGVTTPTEEVLAVWEMIVPDRGVLDAIVSLRGHGVRCCLATNQTNRRSAYMKEQLGYEQVFDDSFYSCDLGVAKPDPAYFTAITDALGVAPETVLFVDDRDKNVAGAREAGLRAETFTAHGGRPELVRILELHGLPTV